VDYSAPEVVKEQKANAFALIAAKRREVAELKAAALADKQTAKNSKSKWEIARDELESLIGEEEKYIGHKPKAVQLTIEDLPEMKAAAVEAAKSQTATEFKPDAPHADLWRQFPISRWNLYGATEGDIKKLAEGKIKGKPGKSYPIKTVGDLSDFCQPWEGDPSRNYGFADIVGLGEAGAARISDAQIRFFNEWNTKGLAQEYAREQGVSIESAKPADGVGSADVGSAGGAGSGGKAGDGEGKNKPRSPGKGGKPAKKRERKPIKHTPTTTPKINPRGDDAAEPFADQPATVPFQGKGEEAAEDVDTAGVPSAAV